MDLRHRLGSVWHRGVSFITSRAQSTHTSFLRLPSQYSALSGPVLSFLLEGDRHRHIDIVVLGCSTGAEPYTIASVLLARHPDVSFRVRGFDIDTSVLERARTARYSPAELPRRSGLSEQFVEETFFVSNGEYVVRPAIAARVSFAAADALDSRLAADVAPADIVFAQNFLLHMSPDAATRAFHNICSLLKARSAVFLDGMDLDLRTNLTQELGLEPLCYHIDAIHRENERTAAWPRKYWGLEPFSDRRSDWRRRFATIFLRNAAC